MVKNGSEKTKNGHTYLQWATALLANLTTLSYGFENGWISPITNYLQSDDSPTGIPLSDNDIARIASTMSLAAAIGVPIYAYIADVYGSKIGVILLTIPQALSWLIRIFCPSTTSIIIARAISGLAAGGVFNVIPMYIKEISQDDMRGVFGTLLVLFQNIGIFVMFIIGAYMNYYTVMYISLALSITVGLLLLKAPQSPLLLVRQGKIEEATATVALLRGLEKDDKQVLCKIECMRVEEERFRALPDISIKSIVKEPSWRRGLLLIFLTFTFHALSGAFVLITYSSAILASTGVEFNISPEMQSSSLPFVMIAATLTLTLIVERFGRKILLTGVFFLTFVSMVVLAGVMIVHDLGGTVPGWLPVSAMALAVAMYAGGIAPLPYIVMTEMFSFQIRAKVMGIIVTYAWFVSFISLAIFTPISAYLGAYTAYLVYGIFNLCGAIFVLIFLPETRGKNDEEIRQMLSRREKGKWVDST